jgi:hypothetical protein
MIPNVYNSISMIRITIPNAIRWAIPGLDFGFMVVWGGIRMETKRYRIVGPLWTPVCEHEKGLK